MATEYKRVLVAVDVTWRNVFAYEYDQAEYEDWLDGKEPSEEFLLTYLQSIEISEGGTVLRDSNEIVSEREVIDYDFDSILEPRKREEITIRGITMEDGFPARRIQTDEDLKHWGHDVRLYEPEKEI